MEQLKPHSKFTRALFFWSGIVATFAYRIIIVLNNVDAIWVKIAWYIGTIGFIVYFIHRYNVSQKRDRLIVNLKLDQKIVQSSELNDEEKTALNYILKTLKISSERVNFIFIFVTSALALAYGIYLDLF